MRLQNEYLRTVKGSSIKTEELIRIRSYRPNIDNWLKKKIKELFRSNCVQYFYAIENEKKIYLHACLECFHSVLLSPNIMMPGPQGKALIC